MSTIESSLENILNLISLASETIEPSQKATFFEHACLSYLDYSSPLLQVQNEDTDTNCITVDGERSLVLILNEIIKTGQELVKELGAALELIAYTFEDIFDKNDQVHGNEYSSNNNASIIQQLLVQISKMYERIAHIMDRNSTYSKLEIADAYLDYAIASKRIGINWNACVSAHLKRMELCPKYKTLDAVRLLGLNVPPKLSIRDLKQDINLEIEEICNEGLFQTNIHKKNLIVDGVETTLDAWYPSQEAIAIGIRARSVMIKSGFTFESIVQIMNYILCEKSYYNGDPIRFFDATSFFNHRHDLFKDSNDIEGELNEAFFNELPGTNPTKVLVYLLLFGVTMRYEVVSNAIGEEQLQTLIKARLIRTSPCDENDVVAENQVYPLHTHCFDDWDVGPIFTTDTSVRNEHHYLFFVTDWPLESMRLPRDAIMSVGHDTLELMSLSSGRKLFEFSPHDNPTRVLDLCCGCGIQGIFAFAREKAMSLDKRCDESFLLSKELLCMDINERAKNFVTANICLNNVGRIVNDDVSSSLDISFVHGDVYKPISHDKSQCVQHQNMIGSFHHILSNPPFVAVPKAPHSQSLCPSLYSTGGGFDGMNLLREILGDCSAHLKMSQAFSVLLVTELPNIEDSCDLIESLLSSKSSSHVNFRVRIIYIGQDVETVEEYSKVREKEAGWDVECRSWNTEWKGIRNRALALISLCNIQEDEKCILEVFDVDNRNDATKFLYENIEEDAFLTMKGIESLRAFCL